MLAAPLVAAAIRARGRASTAIDATELLVTTDQFGGAEPLMNETRARTMERLQPLVMQGEAPVVTGFIGATADGVQTTLGRGGSDYSASILGAALDADEIWIWTDVDGVMTANPSEVSGARTLPEISYSEASELAYYGAKVLHYKTILPAFRQRIPVRILNSFNPSHPGTRVSVEGDPSVPGVKAVTSIPGVSLIGISGTGMQGIPGIVAKTFDVVAEQQSNVLMISQASSENNICFVISASEAPGVVKALRTALEFELARGHIEEIAAQPVAVVAAIGDRMRGTPGIAATVFGALGAERINVIAISQGSSERNISLVVAESDAAAAVRALHQAFRLERAVVPTH
jgi:aspartate kinase